MFSLLQCHIMSTFNSCTAEAAREKLSSIAGKAPANEGEMMKLRHKVTGLTIALIALVAALAPTGTADSDLTATQTPVAASFSNAADPGWD
ncbi:hypothetical protein [Streptomyces sp. NPDC059071]|uniref:hypothetical protein n=1 Tax=unclassified Streptomyces TaxID=2593676 RepID=UPI003634A463